MSNKSINKYKEANRKDIKQAIILRKIIQLVN